MSAAVTRLNRSRRRRKPCSRTAPAASPYWPMLPRLTCRWLSCYGSSSTRSMPYRSWSVNSGLCPRVSPRPYAAPGESSTLRTLAPLLDGPSESSVTNSRRRSITRRNATVCSDPSQRSVCGSLRTRTSAARSPISTLISTNKPGATAASHWGQSCAPSTRLWRKPGVCSSHAPSITTGPSCGAYMPWMTCSSGSRR